MRKYTLRGALRLAPNGIVNGYNERTNQLIVVRQQFAWYGAGRRYVYQVDTSGDCVVHYHSTIAVLEAHYDGFTWLPETRSPERRLFDALVGDCSYFRRTFPTWNPYEE